MVQGALLLQLGTPAAPTPGAVRRYLREFLGDPRVMDLPGPIRRLLLETVILPFRPRRSAEAYGKIWTNDGSPLLVHTEALARKVADRLGDTWAVAVGMRYGEPSIPDAVESLLTTVERLVVLPLFPQYASSSGGSAAARVLEVVAGRWNLPELVVAGPFYDDPAYLDAVAAVSRPHLGAFRPDHVLFSYHGLPERHLRRADATGRCLTDGCCAAIGDGNRSCYRAQCHATSRLLTKRLGLRPDRVTTSFQSRMAGSPWIRPFTDVVVAHLRSRGVRRLAVLTPSFVADCLETLEEIGLRLRDTWLGLGGEELLLVPSLNAEDRWADAVTGLLRRAAAEVRR